MTFWSVPPLFNNKAVAVICSGFSLCTAQVSRVLDVGCGIIAVNNAYEIVSQADVLYACDRKWWENYWYSGALGGAGAQDFKGLKVSLEETPFSDVLRIGNGGSYGFDDRKDYVRTGKNSGVQAAHIAVHAGARRVVLLGCDCRVPDGQSSHFFGEHYWRVGRSPSPYGEFLEGWRSFAAALPQGVEILNCTPDSAIDCFEKARLDDLDF